MIFMQYGKEIIFLIFKLKKVDCKKYSKNIFMRNYIEMKFFFKLKLFFHEIRQVRNTNFLILLKNFFA